MAKQLDFLLFFLYCTTTTVIYLTIFYISSVAATDALLPNQTITDNNGQTLVSSDKTFELGFFSPGSSKNRYLGIWFKDTPDSVVWVANRNDPLADQNATLTIAIDGNLVLLNKSHHIIWSSNTSLALKNPAAQLLNSGNFVLRDNNNKSDVYSWQSFDHPTDTYLPGMKLGWDLKTGYEWYYSSWKSSDDPSPGDYTYRLNIQGLPQAELIYKGSTIKYRTGPWNGIQFSGTPVAVHLASKSSVFFNDTHMYTSYEVLNNSFIIRVIVNPATGTLQRFFSHRGSTTWILNYNHPNDPCDDYGKCGANGICRVNNYPICDCLEGYTPKSPVEWTLQDWTSGCVRKIQMNCSDKVGFHKVSWVKLPDLMEFSLNKKMRLDECSFECSKNCSCKAYSSSNITEGGSGCIMWYGNLVDIKEFKDAKLEQDIYIRLTAAEARMLNGKRNTRSRMKVIAVVSAFSALFILSMPMLVWYIMRKRRIKRTRLKSRTKDIDLPIFDLATVSLATNDFSDGNMIGVGGFGPVYKGVLPTGQEIAVKRLSKNSGQGIEEFMNEVVVIARLQHKNLVGLVGCCIDKEERILIYEYMSNKSLDSFIFDHGRSYHLEWERRFDIAIGIARGLLYLHQDSKLRIIHRDLKTSNILLDGNLQPKISDFGLARIFAGDEKEARTKRVIGTYGYMSPEYAFDGKFSVKSDVYSFGVLLLEIVSGKKNRCFYHLNHHHNLLGHAWLLWNEGRALEVTDTCSDDALMKFQVERCIQVSLLCVQKYPQDRPEMSSVVFMLVNEEAILAQPKEPGFFMERNPSASTDQKHKEDLSVGNELTVTTLDGR